MIFDDRPPIAPETVHAQTCQERAPTGLCVVHLVHVVKHREIDTFRRKMVVVVYGRSRIKMQV